MEPVSTIMMLLASLTSSALTAPTARNLAVLARGALLARGPRTVTACLLAAWPWATKRWGAYEDVLRRSRMSMRRLAQALLCQILALVQDGEPIELVVDETLVRRYGPRVVGVAVHHDAARSSHGRHITTPGHKWVVLSVLVPLPFTNLALALPVHALLYTTKKHARRNREDRPYNHYRTVGELTRLMVAMLLRWAPERDFRLIGDGTYGTHEMADTLNAHTKRTRFRNATLVSRLNKKAALYGPPRPHTGRGRPAAKGDRLPTPEAVIAAPDTPWRSATVTWYGGTRRTVEVHSRTERWYRKGSAATPIRWVAVRDAQSHRDAEVFFTTDLRLSEEEIIEAFVRRWAQETTFQESRRHLGLETLRNRSSQAVRRSVPLLLGAYSLVVVWFAKHVRAPESHRRTTPWYQKRRITFSDMLLAARKDILREGIPGRSPAETAESKILALYVDPINGLGPPTKRPA
jgi:hypothetical protein